MDDFTFVPFDAMRQAPIGNGLLPSIRQVNDILDQVQGKGSALPGPSTVEDLGAIGVGAGASGVAAAYGVPDVATLIVGFSVALWGAANGQNLLASAGKGLFAPAISRIVENQFARPTAAAGGNVVSMPRPRAAA